MNCRVRVFPAIALAFLIPLLLPADEVAPAAPETGYPAEGTQIEGDQLEIFTGEEPLRLLFTGNVRVTSGLFSLTCDELEVIREAGRDDEWQGIQQIVAQGNIRLTQDDRLLTADKAIVLPRESLITLRGQPTLTDPRGTVTGREIILNQQTGRVVIQGIPGEPARVTLPRLTAPESD